MGKSVSDKLQGLVAVGDASLQLSIFEVAEDLGKQWPGSVARLNQVGAGDQGARPKLLKRQLSSSLRRTRR